MTLSLSQSQQFGRPAACAGRSAFAEPEAEPLALPEPDVPEPADPVVLEPFIALEPELPDPDAEPLPEAEPLFEAEPLIAVLSRTCLVAWSQHLP
jgi:hypothetical protein